VFAQRYHYRNRRPNQDNGQKNGKAASYAH
jgi:hypothetical protein